MTKIIKAPEKKQRFKPMSEEQIIKLFNEYVTTRNDSSYSTFPLDFPEDESLICHDITYMGSQLGKYIMKNEESFIKNGYKIEVIKGAIITSLRVSW